MKKLLKIFSYFILFVVLALVSLLVLATVYQDKIIAVALEKVSETVKAPVEIEKVSFSLISRFPLATVKFLGVRLGGENALAGKDAVNRSKTDIVSFGEILVSMTTLPLLDNEIDIVRVEVADGNINYRVDSLGHSNVDFLMLASPDSLAAEPVDTTASPFEKIDLQKFSLKNITLNYADDTAHIAARLVIPDLELKGKIRKENYEVSARGGLCLSDCKFQDTPANLMRETTLDFNLEYLADTLIIESCDLKTDGANLSVQGKAAFLKNIFANLAFQSTGFDLGELIKYAPVAQLSEFGVQEVKGVLDFSGTVYGVVSDSIMPRLDMLVGLTDGYIKTRDYPVLKKLSFAGNLTNGDKQNNETTKAVFNDIKVHTEHSSVGLSFEVENMDRPKYSVSSNLKITLDEFKKIIPDSLIQNLTGRVTAKFTTKGQLPDSITDAFINRALNQSTVDIKVDKLGLKMDSLLVRDLSAVASYRPGQVVVTDLSVAVPTYDVDLKQAAVNLTLTGPLTQPAKLTVQCNSFSAETPQAKVWGTAWVQNVEHPKFKIDAEALLYLSELKPFIPADLLTHISGEVLAKLNTYGTLNLDSIAEQANDIVFKQTRFRADIKNMSAQLPDDPSMHVKNLSGSFDMVPDTLSFLNFTGVAAGVDFAIDSTFIINVYNSVIKNQAEKLIVRGVWSCGAIDHTVFDPLLALMKVDAKTVNNPENVKDTLVSTERTKSTDTIRPIETIQKNEFVGDKADQNSAAISIKKAEKTVGTTPDVEPTRFMLDIKGKASVKSFMYDKKFIDKMTTFLAWPDDQVKMLNSFLREQIFVEDISAKFNITDSLYIVDQFKFKAFGGSANNSLRMRTYADGHQEINLKNLVDKMEISKVLSDCNNFDMSDVITSQNISGLVSGDLRTQLQFVADTLSMKNTRVKGQFKMENGGIYNYEPAMAMSMVPGTKNLDNIKFKTLEMNLFVLNEKIYVPRTYVVSSEMDVAFFGMQSMHDDFEYHAQLRLWQILKSKSKDRRQDAIAGADVDNADKNRNMSKLVYKLIDGKEKMGFDNKDDIKRMETKILVQETALKFVFFPDQVSFETGVK